MATCVCVCVRAFEMENGKPDSFLGPCRFHGPCLFRLKKNCLVVQSLKDTLRVFPGFDIFNVETGSMIDLRQRSDLILTSVRKENGRRKIMIP